MSLTAIAILFFLIAVLYSSVGFGGGSSYIAILLLAGFAIQDVRMTALLCNIIVVSGSCINYFRAGLIPWKKVLPIVLLSVPFAFLGGMIELESAVYKIMASLLLILASLLMFYQVDQTKNTKEIGKVTLSGIGGGIGLVSGAIGIGGGIFLSPILHLLKWQTAKIISGAASFFILVNSIAGIAGQYTHNPSINYTTLKVLGIAVLVGGQLGNYINLRILDQRKVRLFTAILIGLIGLRIFITQIY
ncbi:MAG: sulfite exporter TauE/SafE family protein [Saprospiraceae bacterium]|nr:sulfite exporter TauE/SafE family protein [Saprospiraceae bacterium]